MDFVFNAERYGCNWAAWIANDQVWHSNAKSKAAEATCISAASPEEMLLLL